MLLLDHVGARSGTKRTAPLLYLADGDDLVIVASKGGYPKNPAWFHNLVANPDTTAQVGRERRAVHARVATTAERDRLWPRVVNSYPAYADYRRAAKDARSRSWCSSRVSRGRAPVGGRSELAAVLGRGGLGLGLDPAPRLHHRGHRAAHHLGDLAVGTVGIAADLELDQRLGAKLRPLLAGRPSGAVSFAASAAIARRHCRQCALSPRRVHPAGGPLRSYPGIHLIFTAQRSQHQERL